MSIQIMVAVCHGTQNQEMMNLATRWVKQLGGTITGFGVVDESVWAPTPAMALPGGNASLAPPDREIVIRAKNRVQQSLEKWSAHCHQNDVEYQQIDEIGTSHDQILMEAQGHDVILMGKPETSDLGISVPAKTIIEDVLRHSPRPVIVVPDHAQEGKGILVAYDGSLQAARALQALVSSGLTALGNITVLYVNNEFEETGDKPIKLATHYLAGHDVYVETHQIVDKAAEHSIVEEAKRRGSELIVMGAYGQSRFAEFFLGSTTGKVIDQSSVPLFLFH